MGTSKRERIKKKKKKHRFWNNLWGQTESCSFFTVTENPNKKKGERGTKIQVRK